MTDSENELTKTFYLVRRAKEGHDEALGRLFDRYHARVKKIVSLRLGSKLREVLDAEDIIQETFMGAFKTFDRFEMQNEASVINWLSRIAERAINGAADHFGAAKRKAPRVPIDQMDTQDRAVQVPDDRRGPRTSVAVGEESRIIEECIAELPEQYREIIILRNYVEYGWEEVAREHGRPSVDAARMLHSKAMVELNRRVRAKMGDNKA